MAVPAVSVVMPVHNAARYLDEAVASVLAQDFSDFELVAYDDGSTDASHAKLLGWAGRDARVRVEPGERRLGAAGSSNRVTALGRAPLIARLDADDRMLPGRLSAQIAAFAAQPGAVLVGALSWTVDPAGRRVRQPDYARLLRRSRHAPFAHSSIMVRRGAVEQAGGYRAEAEKWEDVDLFLHLAELGEVWTIPRALIEYRQNPATTRLDAGLGPLEQAMEAMCTRVDATPPRGDGKISPAAYRHIGATLLWSGGRPRLLGRILRKARLDFDRESLALLGWAVGAGLAPGITRGLLRARLAAGNRRALRILGETPLVRWRPACSDACWPRWDRAPFGHFTAGRTSP